MSETLPSEIRMGNDIARALRHLPEEKAAESVATHLKKFWEPRMRRALVERVHGRDPRVDPLLALAVEKYVTEAVNRPELAEPSGG